MESVGVFQKGYKRKMGIKDTWNTTLNEKNTVSIYWCGRSGNRQALEARMKISNLDWVMIIWVVLYMSKSVK